MTLWNTVQQAIVNLTTSKLRSFLAILGILVGTAAVVALISCGQLATEKALAQFKALGTDLLAITLFQHPATKVAHSEGQIPINLWRQIPEKIPAIADLAIYSTSYQPISFQGKPLQGAIIGADEALAHVIHIQLAQGYFVSFVDNYEHFCVIGDTIARQLKQINLESPMGQQLRIGQTLYTIIGIAKPWTENGFFNEDINRAIIIPIAGIALVSQDSKINNAIVSLKPNSSIDTVLEQIKRTIHHYAPKLTVLSRSPKQIIASMESQGRIFTLLLAIIGGISLFVGGIGVMNVMLVSVSERKKEIGIRKAVGAKNSEIQQLFLIESVILALIGGALGIVFGLIFTRCVAYFSHWPFSFFLTPPLAGFAVSAATGIFFGYYPAKRAAQLEPVISLRSE